MCFILHPTWWYIFINSLRCDIFDWLHLIWFDTSQYLMIWYIAVFDDLIHCSIWWFDTLLYLIKYISYFSLFLISQRRSVPVVLTFCATFNRLTELFQQTFDQLFIKVIDHLSLISPPIEFKKIRLQHWLYINLGDMSQRVTVHTQNRMWKKLQSVVFCQTQESKKKIISLIMANLAPGSMKSNS